ncbi:MAG TPA: dihydropteroate synthase [bacterium]|nr:dihydropteroate synthase [bacterium]
MGAMLDFAALHELLARHGDAWDASVPGFTIRGRPFDFAHRRYLMGVINLSPDSWYRESVCKSEGEAITRGRMLAAQGADLVDIGAESTLPDAERVGPAGQIARLLPVVRRLAAEGVLVSVESYHPEVLEAAAQAGAAVFNLTGTREEVEVYKLAQRFEAAVVHCYVQGETVRAADDFTFSADMAATLTDYFRERIARARAAGVTRNIVDPGLGFYYRNLEDGDLRVAYQLQTFLHTFRLRPLGCPTLNILPHAPELFGEENRRAAEPFFAVLALLGGTHIVRTHELDTVARIRAALERYRPDASA